MEDANAPAERPSAPPATGLRGDLARLFSERGLHEGRPTLGRALERVLTRPGPMALALYRASHRLWEMGLEPAAEILWRANYFLTGADIHPGAEIGGGLRITHTAGIVIGKGVRVGNNVTLLHGVTLGGSARGWFDGVFEDGFPEIGDDTEIMAGAFVLGPVRVGRGCFVGANAVLARDLADGDAYTPGREIGALRGRIEALEAEVAELKARLEARPAASPRPRAPRKTGSSGSSGGSRARPSRPSRRSGSSGSSGSSDDSGEPGPSGTSGGSGD